jgi:chemotaxis protein CheD
MLTAPLIAPEPMRCVRQILVGMGAAGVAHGQDALRTVGLGSCLAIVILAPVQELAALAHCMLPVREESSDAPAKFVDSAVPALIDALEAQGGTRPYSAVLVGGASMFPGVPQQFLRDIAGRNIEAARLALAAIDVPIRLEDVGGHAGRSVLVEPATQRVMVQTIRGGSQWL